MKFLFIVAFLISVLNLNATETVEDSQSASLKYEINFATFAQTYGLYATKIIIETVIQKINRLSLKNKQEGKFKKIVKHIENLEEKEKFERLNKFLIDICDIVFNSNDEAVNYIKKIFKIRSKFKDELLPKLCQELKS